MTEKFFVTLHIKTAHSVGSTATAGTRLKEPLRFATGVTLRSGGPADPPDIVADIEVTASNDAEAREKALRKAKLITYLLGFYLGGGFTVDPDGVAAITSSENQGAARVYVYESIKTSVQLVVNQPTEFYAPLIARFNDLDERERDDLGELLELYNLSWQESFPRSRFLTLVTLLESMLAPEQDVAEGAALLGSLEQTLERLSEESGVSAKRLDDIRTGLGRLRKQSIGERFRNLAKGGGLSPSEADSFVKEVYGARSRISHRGEVPTDEELQSLITKARSMAESCLRDRFQLPSPTR